MTRCGWIAGLLAGAASGGLQAQEAAPRVEFRGADGKPLPPEVQRQLEEQFKKDPSLLKQAQRAPGAAAGEVVVTGRKPRGAVVGDIPPERTFGQLDIRAYGADNIGALLEAIAPQVTSNRGRGDGGPVTLLNGRRISDFSEIARIPSEAIERMEVFPDELALKYGYRADQKVVNIVTFERFESRVGQTGYLVPTEGGRDTGLVNADYLSLRGDTRLGFGASYDRSGALLESERDVRQLSGMPALGRTRTLLPESERLALDALVSAPVLDGVSVTLNGRFEASRSESLLGLGGDGALRRDSDRDVAHLGTTVGGRTGKWQWTFTGNYDRTANDIRTDVGDPAGRRDVARSVDSVANADLLLSGPIVELPAGPLAASVSGGFAFRDFDGRSSRTGIEQRTTLARDRGAVQLNLDLPLLSRQEGEASPLGTLSANANAAVERLSDVGTLRTLGYGLVWSPIAALGVVASVTHEEGAPTPEQLGGPLVVTPNVRTFDFSRREVVDVTRVFGGNRALRADDRRVIRLGLTARPLVRTDLTLSVDYNAIRIDDPIAAFPILTPPLEAAFPGRFARDTDGRLQRIDATPVNFVRSEQRQLRTGINFTRPLGPVPPGYRDGSVRVFASEAEARRMIPGAIFTKAAPNSAMSRNAANLTSRVFVSLYHNWYLEDAIVLRDDFPALDLLDGDAIDFRGGRRRHELEFQAGAFKRGLGARVTATWQSGTTVRGLGGTAGDLRFADFARVDLNLFANLADRFGGNAAPAWLKGTRASIGVTNLFNTRPQVRDRAGETPLSYQPAYLDPPGRVLSFSLRKVF